MEARTITDVAFTDLTPAVRGAGWDAAKVVAASPPARGARSLLRKGGKALGRAADAFLIFEVADALSEEFLGFDPSGALSDLFDRVTGDGKIQDLPLLELYAMITQDASATVIGRPGVAGALAVRYALLWNDSDQSARIARKQFSTIAVLGLLLGESEVYNAAVILDLVENLNEQLKAAGLDEIEIPSDSDPVGTQRLARRWDIRLLAVAVEMINNNFTGGYKDWRAVPIDRAISGAVATLRRYFSQFSRYFTSIDAFTAATTAGIPAGALGNIAASMGRTLALASGGPGGVDIRQMTNDYANRWAALYSLDPSRNYEVMADQLLHTLSYAE